MTVKIQGPPVAAGSAASPGSPVPQRHHHNMCDLTFQKQDFFALCCVLSKCLVGYFISLCPYCNNLFFPPVLYLLNMTFFVCKEVLFLLKKINGLKLCTLISYFSHRNLKTSWQELIILNTICIIHSILHLILSTYWNQ